MFLRALLFCCVSRFGVLGTAVCQVPLSVGFAKNTQEYWSGLLCLSSGYLLDPGIKPTPLTSPSLAGGFFTTSAIPVLFTTAKSWKQLKYPSTDE